MTDRIDIVVQERGTTRVSRSLDSLGNSAGGANRQVFDLQRTLRTFAIGAALTAATRQALQFNTAVAEVRTLVTGTAFDVRRLEDALLDQASAFGSLPTTQAQAAYQIISAGAGSATEAIETLDAANRLAIGGVTDVATAADGLVSVMNAYGDAVESATDVSDTLFVGVRAGRTTIEELSGSIGQVAPLAAAANVSFEELVASVAALTTGGVSTRQSVTGLRAILASVVRPTQQAQEAAARLGLEFNAAALESQGLERFLANVIERTGGSTEELAMLFGGVEALVPVLSLAGETGDTFTEILEQMGERAGSTEAAFNELANSPGFQIDRVVSTFNAEFTRFANVLLQLAVPAIRLLADSLTLMSEVLTVAAVLLAGRFASVAIGAAITGVQGLTFGTTVLNARIAALVTGSNAAVVSVTRLGGAMALAGRLGASAFALIGGPIGLAVIGVLALFAAVNSVNTQLMELAAAAGTFNETIEGTEGVIRGVEQSLLDVGAVSPFTGLAEDSSEAAVDIDTLSSSTLTLEERINSLAEARRNDALAALQQQRAAIESQRAQLLAQIDQTTSGFSGFSVNVASVFTGSPSTSDFDALADQLEGRTAPALAQIDQAIEDINNATLDQLVGENDRLALSLEGGANASQLVTRTIRELEQAVLVAGRPTAALREQAQQLINAGLNPLTEASSESGQRIVELTGQLQRFEAAADAQAAAQRAADSLRANIQGLEQDILVLNQASGVEQEVFRELIQNGIDPVTERYSEQGQQIETLVTQRRSLLDAAAAEQVAAREQERLDERRNTALMARSNLTRQSIQDLQAEATALSQTGSTRQAQLNILNIEQQTRQALRDSNSGFTEEQINNLARLGDSERQQITELTQNNEVLRQRGEILSAIQQPGIDFANQLMAINQLLAEGVISTEQANIALQNSALVSSVRDLDQELFGVFGQGQQALTDQVRLQADERREIVRAAIEQNILTEQEGAERIRQIRAQANAAIVSNQLAAFGTVAASGQNTFQQLAQVAQTAAGDQSDAYRALFAVSQGFALANAIVQTASGVATALGSSPPPLNFINAALVGAAGAAQVGTIIQQTAAGFRDGTEFINGPGGVRSDSIPAMLSRGEAVINAAGNAANPGMAAAMNRGEVVGGRGPVVNNFNFGPGTNTDDFRRAQRRIDRNTRRRPTP